MDLLEKDGLEFVKLPPRRPGHTSFLWDSSNLELEKEFSTKDGFVTAVKRYNIKNKVNFYVVKSQSGKFKTKFVT
ncbi:hypothetical protein PVK06_039933 [Gossypium arboreum]|uniref:Uncharacterized protein n=1 Tax=Gossypium arboreum TaxID=29729 RepID=A0ABR0N454_GOSAR|nr:hypothetical protein PVK06_039933 [Gossypium arboreum]